MSLRSLLAAYVIFFSSVITAEPSKTPDHQKPAAEKPGHQQIEAAVENFIRHSLENAGNLEADTELSIRVANLDPRFNLRCAQPLRVEWESRARQGGVSLKVNCDGASRWSIFVPANISLFKPVVVSRQTLSRGQRLGARDLALKKMDISRLRFGYFTEVDTVANQAVKRPIPANTLITPSLLIKAQLINKGDSVIIQARRGNLMVKMSGTALSDGREGRQIRVRNDRSKRIIKAQVVGPGIVEVDF